jgi:hypothetical protein
MVRRTLAWYVDQGLVSGATIRPERPA